MSYSISIVDSETEELVFFEKPHAIFGSNVCIGGTTQASLDVTYNYSDFYYSTMGGRGIRSIYGVPLADTIERLDAAISELGSDPPSDDYWAATEGNARTALENLKKLAEMALEEFPDRAMEFQGD